jgi:hypothetical protein
VGYGKPQAGFFIAAFTLGRKIGLENFFDVFGRYAAALILDGDINVSAGGEDTVGTVDGRIFKADRYGPSGRHGFRGIDDQVVDGLADLPGIDKSGPEPLAGASSQRTLEPLREKAAVFSTTRAMSVLFFVGWPPFEKVISRRVRVLATREAAKACSSRPDNLESEPHVPWPGKCCP